jgi:serine/threonine protein kinase
MDLKTQNLMLDSHHSLKLIDFDLACTNTNKPYSGIGQGSLNFRAPELVELF